MLCYSMLLLSSFWNWGPPWFVIDVCLVALPPWEDSWPSRYVFGSFGFCFVRKRKKQVDVEHTQEGIGHKPAGQGEG
jgi:hypothetical protein